VNNEGGGKHGSAIMLATRFWIWPATLLVCALSLLFSSSAWADSRVVVRAFKGPKGTALRVLVVKELKDRGYEVVANKDVDVAAGVRGVRADEPASRGELSSDLTIHAWIDGRVSLANGEFTLVISVQEGTGGQVAELTATRPQSVQLATVIKREFWKTAGPAIETARAPEPPAPPAPAPSQPAWPADVIVAPRTPPPAEEGSPGAGTREGKRERKRERKLSMFEASVSLNTLTRTLRFREAYALGASDYQLAAAPLVIGSARIYPGTYARAVIGCCIGLDGSIQRAFSLGSQSADGVTYRTRFESYTASLVGRIPLALHELNVLAGYGVQRFLIADSARASPPTPSVDYRHIRLGGAGRFALGSRIKLGFEASYLLVLGTGQLASAAWYPRNTGSGVEGTVYVDVSLIGGLAARARVSYQRSAFAFAPPTNQRSESGVVDTYITAGLGLSCAY
jgi:hypothetical protein